MTKNINIWTGKDDIQLEITYNVLVDDGDWATPPYEALDIIKIMYNKHDVTNLAWDIDLIKEKLFKN